MRVVSAAPDAPAIVAVTAAHASRIPLALKRKNEMGVMNCFASAGG
jgi:hypothetical protein